MKCNAMTWHDMKWHDMEKELEERDKVDSREVIKCNVQSVMHQVQCTGYRCSRESLVNAQSWKDAIQCNTMQPGNWHICYPKTKPNQQVADRLDQQDCKTDGWLLDGFPRTPGQADALASAGVPADCFIFLNVPDEILVDRVVGRRTDPDTGKIYHMTFSPPDDKDILARLEQRSDDTEEKVKVRLEQFHANVEAVKGSYSEIGVEIDGTAAPDVVSKAVAAAISSKVSA